MAKNKQHRKEILSLRIEPKIKYLVDMASRIQRRNVTSYVESVLEESLKSIHIEENIDLLNSDLWDIDEADRFIKLAYTYPDLLTFEEQRMLKVINENFVVFKKSPEDFVALTDEEEIFYRKNIPSIDLIDFKKVRSHWENLVNHAQGNIDLDFLSK